MRESPSWEETGTSRKQKPYLCCWDNRPSWKRLSLGSEVHKERKLHPWQPEANQSTENIPVDNPELDRIGGWINLWCHLSALHFYPLWNLHSCTPLAEWTTDREFGKHETGPRLVQMSLLWWLSPLPVHLGNTPGKNISNSMGCNLRDVWESGGICLAHRLQKLTVASRGS